MKDPVERTPLLSNRRVGMLVALAVFLAACVFFVADNFVLTDVRFFTVDVQMRLAWLVMLTFAIGVASGIVLSWLWRKRRQRDAGGSP